jgi:heme exporter protein D
MMDTVAEFFNMGGYALYVWGSFGVTAILMIAEPLLIRARRKAVLQRIFRLIRIKAEERT